MNSSIYSIWIFRMGKRRFIFRLCLDMGEHYNVNSTPHIETCTNSCGSMHQKRGSKWYNTEPCGEFC